MVVVDGFLCDDCERGKDECCVIYIVDTKTFNAKNKAVVKIGTTKDLKSRLSTMQTYFCSPLEIICTFHMSKQMSGLYAFDKQIGKLLSCYNLCDGGGTELYDGEYIEIYVKNIAELLLESVSIKYIKSSEKYGLKPELYQQYVENPVITESNITTYKHNLYPLREKVGENISYNGKCVNRFGNFKDMLKFYEEIVTSQEYPLGYFERVNRDSKCKFHMSINFTIEGDMEKTLLDLERRKTDKPRKLGKPCKQIKYKSLLHLILSNNPDYSCMPREQQLEYFNILTHIMMYDILCVISSKWEDLFPHKKIFDPNKDIIIYNSISEGVKNYHLVFPTLVSPNLSCVNKIFLYFTSAIKQKFGLDFVFNSGDFNNVDDICMIHSSNNGGVRFKTPIYSWSFSRKEGKISGTYTPTDYFNNYNVKDEPSIDINKYRLHCEILDSFITIFPKEMFISWMDLHHQSHENRGIVNIEQ